MSMGTVIVVIITVRDLLVQLEHIVLLDGMMETLQYANPVMEICLTWVRRSVLRQWRGER
eukprot:7731572-Ditylum_brightwellii.AAC.1